MIFKYVGRTANNNLLNKINKNFSFVFLKKGGNSKRQKTDLRKYFTLCMRKRNKIKTRVVVQDFELFCTKTYRWYFLKQSHNVTLHFNIFCRIQLKKIAQK